jgi:hypothetical protein
MAQITETAVAITGTVPADGPVPTPGGPLSYIHWGPAFAGAVVAASTIYVLMTFAGSIGLAVASPSPSWRDTSIALAILSGVWVLVVVVGSISLGGYLAGRVRSTWAASSDEIEFRDGAHGLLVWGLTIAIGSMLIWLSASTISAVAPSRTDKVAGEPAFLQLEVDRLFRSERPPEQASPEARAEAARIIMTGLGHSGIAPEDRVHLVRLVSARTGLGPADADRRVTLVVNEAKASSRRARASGIIVGFLTAAALAAGAAAAWFAAGIGGSHRDQSISPPLRWRRRRLA